MKDEASIKKETIKYESDALVPYESILGEISFLIDEARRSAARSVNCVMTAAYWLIGRRIVESEQKGKIRAGYGEKLLEHLADDLTTKFGRGFSYPNLNKFRQFFLVYPPARILSSSSRELDIPILSTASIELKSQDARKTSADKSAVPPTHEAEGILQTAPEESKVWTAQDVFHLASRLFPLQWSAYVRLLSVKNEKARIFYETEALRGGWSVRQLNRQIDSQFYERTALSHNRAAMLRKGEKAQPNDVVPPEEEIKDPYVLEFLGLKDEYSERDLEQALIQRLETFLLELGSEFCFVGRQKRLHIGDEWYRVDLLFFHRRLRCLVLVDLKIGKFTHADAGQMHLYLNYARERWVMEGENPPVGLILCAHKDKALAHYALEGLANKVMAAEYQTALPDEQKLAEEITRTQAILLERKNRMLPSRKDKRSRSTVEQIENEENS